MKYYKETANTPYVGGRPYKREEITRDEALQHVTTQDLADMEENVRQNNRHFPGICELLEVSPGFYVGVSMN